MRRTRHRSEQIVAKLREADTPLGGSASIGQVCRKLGVAHAAFHRWKNQSRGSERDLARSVNANDARRLDKLEHEDARLGKPVAKQALGNAMLKGLNSARWRARPRPPSSNRQPRSNLSSFDPLPGVAPLLDWPLARARGSDRLQVS